MTRRTVSPLRWVLLVAIVAALLAGANTALHFRQAAVLQRAADAMDRLQEARNDVARGFLAVTLAGQPGAPYGREEGLSLLGEAETAIDDYLRLWTDSDLGFPTDAEALVSEFHHRCQALLRVLLGGNELDRRVTYYQLDRVIDRIEGLSRQEREALVLRLAQGYFGVMAVGFVLVLLLCGGLYSLARDRDRAQARLAQVARDLHVAFWYRDLASGRTEVTEAWWELLGLEPRRQVPSMAEWSQRILAEDRPGFLQRIACFQASDEKEFCGEYRVVLPSGDHRWIQTRVTTRRDGAGRALSQFGCNVDITETKRLEADRASLEAQVVQAQKTDALGQLAGGIAHDLNNLLVPLMTYSDLGIQGTGKPPEHYFRRIRDVTERAQGLTRQILAFSRQQVLQKRPVDLASLVRTFEPMLRRLVPENLKFEVDLPEGLPPILADGGQVEQVLLNLVVNARDAMPDGGTVGISLLEIELDQAFQATHYGITPGRHVVLSVSDTGVGMSPEVRARIFEPFFTTKARGQGTGLGLATVQGIVRQHGGQIGVYSEAGHGTVFRIYWPVPTGTIDEAVPDPAGPSRGHETILVVEDEDIVREVITESLESQGYRVLGVPGPLQALAVTEAYDLVVTDVVMPDLNGRELRDRLVAQRPGVPVLFISGYTDRILAGLDHEGPGHGFLQKPFAVDVLGRKVRELLDAEP